MHDLQREYLKSENFRYSRHYNIKNNEFFYKISASNGNELFFVLFKDLEKIKDAVKELKEKTSHMKLIHLPDYVGM